ncbi:MAG: right-handed parallel beta-helix repeat-containing protein [candidate division KSB1 bacterium]|nr:right-handed parallel beta-helix repeat-containing protein [candidate division KSB1 bacterium]MDZ7358042.1 right-handed parallel beta-helix repeat-containing protein [candidate division KSB1 bacterium]MDZ7376416.1 right-handed parallel beta-helix repeat-containing protein [candidate division KSB1 bacterium]
MKKFVFLFLLQAIFTDLLWAQKYIAPDGNDANPGTITQPFGTFAKAISEAMPGDTIYVRGGTYHLTSTITISAAKSGTEEKVVTMSAFKDEVPLLDFSAQSLGSKGISLRANYWHIIGLHVKGAGDNGMEINFGSNNIIERCVFFENRDSGLQLSNGSANNRIINCDSYYNADPPDYADADGFAPKLTVGSGNYFYGCRSWGNCDDGWDGYLRGATDVTTTLENCWSWSNGYLKDGTDPGSQANGNGFKMGGGDNSNSEALMHHQILVRCVAFNNKNKGFDQNNNVGSMTLFNCTGYHNKAANYRIQRSLNPGQSLIIKNCVSFQGLVQLGGFAIQEANSWMPPFLVTAEDFLSLDANLAAAPRKPDGSLPDIDFLHLATGSDLIDAGVEVGLPFSGNAPDLGAFETESSTEIEIAIANPPAQFELHQNYPNPFNAITTICFSLPELSHVQLRIFNPAGQLVRIIADQNFGAGTHEVTWHGDNGNGQSIGSGVYLYQMNASGRTFTRKLIVIR